MKLKKVISSVMVIIMLSMTLLNLWVNPVNAETNDLYEVTVNVTYGQTEARSMLQMINEFRTGSDAYYWNEDNTAFVYCENLSNLVYNYDLEKIAMQRAAEIAIFYHNKHIRPNNTSCFTCTYNGIQSYGENIAAGYSTATNVFDAWREDEDLHDKQGHRKTMLAEEFNAVGIGHVYYNGYHYWVQEFGITSETGASTTASDGQEDVKVDISSSNITSITNESLSKNSINLEVNETEDIPVVTASILTTEGWPENIELPVTINPTWISGNEAIAKVENGKIIAVSVGSTNLTATINGKAYEVSVTVTEPKISVETAEITLNPTRYEYTGTEIKPEIRVSLGATTLSSDDYDITYEDNINVGTAKIIITGKGNYTGQTSKTFEIYCDHTTTEVRNEKEATCTEKGYTGDTYCTSCGEKVANGTEIEATGHSLSDEYEKDDTNHSKRCTICGEIIESEEHIYSATINPIDDYYHEKVCTICGYVKNETHTTETRGYVAPTCSTDGYTGDTYCVDCNRQIEIGNTIPKLDHVNTKVINVKEATCKEEGYTGDKYCMDCNSIIEHGEAIPKIEHTGGTATCISKAVCEMCGEEYGEIDAHNHINTELRDELAPTCTVDGYSGDKYCADCGILIKGGTIIPAGHTGGTATCVSKAVCEVCGAEYGEINSNNHTHFELRNVKDVTLTEEGYTGDVYCTDCGQLIKKGTTVSILKKDTNEDAEMTTNKTTLVNPNTGDNTKIELWICLFIISAFGLVVTKWSFEGKNK